MSRKIPLFVFNNLVFAIYAGAVFFRAAPVMAGAVGAIILFLPGLGITRALLRREKDAVITLAATVLVSSLVLAAGLLSFKLANVEVSRRSFALYLFIVSNLALLLPVRAEPFRLDRHHAAVFFIAVSLLGVNARLMPSIVDQDLGFTVPAYGLIHELKPYMNVSRVPYMLDHQEWPAFMSAASIFLMGELDTVKEEYLHAKRIEASYPRDEIYKAWHTIPGTEEYIFENKLAMNPRLVFSARVPHFFMAGLLLMVLFEIVRRETSSVFLGWTAAAVAMSPELFVRYSSAGWTPDILYVMILMCYIYLYRGGARFGAFLAAFCAGALISQKAVILPAAIVLADLFRLKWRLGRDSLWSAAGWAAGLGAMALYGYYLNWQCFIHSFIVDHGVVKLVDGIHNIPGFLASWTRGALYMNPFIFTLGLVSVAAFSFKKRNTRFCVIPMWFWAGALIFIFCVWPNIRNTCLAYIPMIIAMACFIGERGARARKALSAMVLLFFLLNSALMVRTYSMPDFFYGINEVGNTPKTVLYEYYDSMDRLFGGEGKPRAMGAVDAAFWSKAAAVFPGSPLVNYRLGKAYIEAGRPGEAVAFLEKASGLRPASAQINDSLARAYLKAGSYDKAAGIYEAAVKRSPDDSRSYDDLGLAYYLSGRNEEAVAAFKKALELDHRNVAAYNDLGNAYRAQGRFDEAVSSYGRAISIRPHSAGLYQNLGNAFYEAERYEDAIAPYRKVLDIDRRSVDVYNNLNSVYMMLGREDDAIALGMKMVKIMPGDAQPYYNLAVAFYSKRITRGRPNITARRVSAG